VLSDLHLEFGLVGIPDTDADLVVLAGDVSVGPRGLDWIRNRFPGKEVVYVLDFLVELQGGYDSKNPVVIKTDSKARNS
jgi:hypothetical protein